MAKKELTEKEKILSRWTSECHVRGFQRVRAELVNGSRSRMTSESGHAEVVVHLVQYDQLGRAHQFSVTRHVRLHYGLQWVGINPGMGRTVMVQLVAAEKRREEAHKAMREKEAVSFKAETEYAALGEKPPEEAEAHKKWVGGRRQLGKIRKNAARDLAEANQFFAAAHALVGKLFNEVPPMVEFVF